MPMFLYSVSEIYKQRLNLETEPLKAVLMAASFVPDYKMMRFLSDLPAGDIKATASIAEKEWLEAGLKASDVVFTGLTGTPVNSIVTYVDRGAAASSILVGYVRLATPPPPIQPTGDFYVRFSPFGLVSWKNQPFAY